MQDVEVVAAGRRCGGSAGSGGAGGPGGSSQKNVSLDELKAALTTASDERIAQLLADKVITAEQATAMKAFHAQQVESMLTAAGPGGPMGGRGFRGGPFGRR